MNRNPRNLQLLSQMSAHNQFRETVAPAAFKIGNEFENAVEAVGQDRRLSAEGRKDAARGHLTKALRDLDNLQKPVDEYRKQTASMRSGIKAPSYDKADLAAALLRRELRDRAALMSFGQRAALLSGPTRDTNFIDALLEQPAWVSGVDLHNPNEAELYETAKQSRLVDLNGPLMDALAARDTVESEIAMVLNVAMRSSGGRYFASPKLRTRTGAATARRRGSVYIEECDHSASCNSLTRGLVHRFRNS